MAKITKQYSIEAYQLRLETSMQIMKAIGYRLSDIQNILIFNDGKNKKIRKAIFARAMNILNEAQVISASNINENGAQKLQITVTRNLESYKKIWPKIQITAEEIRGQAALYDKRSDFSYFISKRKYTKKDIAGWILYNPILFSTKFFYQVFHYIKSSILVPRIDFDELSSIRRTAATNRSFDLEKDEYNFFKSCLDNTLTDNPGFITRYIRKFWNTPQVTINSQYFMNHAVRLSDALLDIFTGNGRSDHWDYIVSNYIIPMVRLGVTLSLTGPYVTAFLYQDTITDLLRPFVELGRNICYYSYKGLEKATMALSLMPLVLYEAIELPKAGITKGLEVVQQNANLSLGGKISLFCQGVITGFKDQIKSCQNSQDPQRPNNSWGNYFLQPWYNIGNSFDKIKESWDKLPFIFYNESVMRNNINERFNPASDATDDNLKLTSREIRQTINIMKSNVRIANPNGQQMKPRYYDGDNLNNPNYLYKRNALNSLKREIDIKARADNYQISFMEKIIDSSRHNQDLTNSVMVQNSNFVSGKVR